MLHDAASATSCVGKAGFEEKKHARRYSRLDHRFYVGVVVCVQPASAPSHSRGYLK